MANRKSRTHRYGEEALRAIAARKRATGLTATKVIEDAVLRRDRFSKPILAMIEAKANAEGWSFDETIEYCVIRQLGAS